MHRMATPAVSWSMSCKTVLLFFSSGCSNFWSLKLGESSCRNEPLTQSLFRANFRMTLLTVYFVRMIDYDTMQNAIINANERKYYNKKRAQRVYSIMLQRQKKTNVRFMRVRFSDFVSLPASFMCMQTSFRAFPSLLPQSFFLFFPTLRAVEISVE